MYVEDRISTPRQQSMETPFGWLVCFEGRPLQGIPPKANGPHILFFSDETKAQEFIADRQRIFGVEPLSIISIDAPDILKGMALDPSNDIRYVAPPCGIVLDFNYTIGKSRKVLTPPDVNRMLPVEIASALGFKSSQVVEPAIESTMPVLKTDPKPQARQKRPFVAALVTCGSLLLVGLLLLCVTGIWYGMSRGVIPALPFLYTPTSTSTPTVTPSPTITPTPTVTPFAWDINIQDNFDNNAHGWPTSANNPVGECGHDGLMIQYQSLVWEITSADSCNWWYYPDIPAVADFDLSVDVRRSGTPGNAAGLVFRIAEDANPAYYLFLVDDINQRYHVAVNNFGNWTTLVDWELDSNILADSYNRIGISARGSEFTFIINGVAINTINDDKLTIGKVGIITGVYNAGDQDTITYKNFELSGMKK